MSNSKYNDLYRFEVKEFMDLCTSEKALSLMYNFTKGLKEGGTTFRKRTDAEKKARADFYGLTPEDIAD